VSLNGEHVVTDRNWIRVEGLRPDTAYPYEIRVDGRRLGAGTVRTWPDAATALHFFVIGDYGNGSRAQRDVAAAMESEYRRLAAQNKFVCFVLTAGDNIYGRTLLGIPTMQGTGADDADWEERFFSPYEPLLREIPFYPSLGNHDGRDSESAADLPVYLDDFFFPDNRPAPQYAYSVAGLADFFAIDTTSNTDTSVAPRAAWLEGELARSKAPWRIVYGHHPPYNAGPGHGGSLSRIRPFVEAMARHKVAACFCGHEHNFQVSTADTALAPGVMFVSGSGGELRSGDVRDRMRAEHIAAWAPVNQFLSVEIDGDELRVTPLGPTTVSPVDAGGRAVTVPFVVHRP
jgi:hypothetical protein